MTGEYEELRRVNKASLALVACLFLGIFGFFTGLWLLGLISRFLEDVWP